MSGTSFFCSIDWKLALQAAQIVTTILVACLVYLFAKRNMRNETRERLNRFKKEKKLEAMMAFWGLLAYTTEVENPHSVLVWIQDKTSKQKTWFFHKENASEYLTRLNAMFYEHGYGLFLGKEARNFLFEYRGIVYGFLLREKKNAENLVKIENEEIVSRMKKIHESLLACIKQNI